MKLQPSVLGQHNTYAKVSTPAGMAVSLAQSPSLSMTKGKHFCASPPSFYLCFIVFLSLIFATSCNEALSLERILTTSCSTKSLLNPNHAVAPNGEKPDPALAPQVVVNNADVLDKPLVNHEDSASDAENIEGIQPPELGQNEEESSKQRPQIKPILQMGVPVVIGKLDKRLVQRIGRGHAKKLSACAESQMVEGKALSGKIILTLTIEGNGSVSDVSIKSTSIHNTAVEACIIGSMKLWQFPSPKGNTLVKVDYPLTFGIL